ncbi:hypothetical protein ES703_91871 [subsurface metagenome]
MKKTKSIPLLFSIVLAVTLIFASLPFDSLPSIRFAYADATTEDEYGNFIISIQIAQKNPETGWWDFHRRCHENVYDGDYYAINYTENEEIGLQPYWETRIMIDVAINDTIATDADQALAKTFVILTVTNAPELDGVMSIWSAPDHRENGVEVWDVYYATDWVTGPSVATIYTISWEYKVLVED